MKPLHVMTYYFASFACVLCIDPDKSGNLWRNLGRVDYGNMCDQQRMEKLVERLEDASMFMNYVDEGDYKDVCNWPGVIRSDN